MEPKLLSKSSSTSLFTRFEAVSKALGLASLASFVAAPASGQNLSMQVVRAGDVVTFSVTGATPSSLMCLALDPMGCPRDVDGDRAVNAADVAATSANFGPVMTFAKKIFDQNNDGYVNELDRDLVIAASGCTNYESSAIPGCSISADLDPANALLYTFMTNAAGAGSYTVTLPPGLDLPLYSQTIDFAGCRKSALRADRYVHTNVAVGPMASMSVVVRSDFTQPVTSGLVAIATDQDTLVSSRNSVGQTGIVDISPMTSGMITVGETPCSFVDGSETFDGVALGILQETSTQTRPYRESLTQFVYQPVAFDVKFGGAERYAPFNGLWEVIPPAQGPAYDPFDAQLAALTTASEIEHVLEYYGVPGTVGESAPAALFLRVPKKVNLDPGTTGHNGFGISLQNWAGLGNSISIATRHLYTGKADDVGPQITANAINAKSMLLSFHGTLEAGDYVILLGDVPFATTHAAFPSSPPDLSAMGGDTTQGPGPGPCPAGGTPPPPANPPAVPGACEGGLGLLWELSDCVLTGNYTKTTACGTVGPILTKTCSMPGGANMKEEVKITHTGSASVNVEIGGVGVNVGTEISVETTTTVDYPVPPGNGQNIAFYLYVKICVTRYQIAWHTWEFPYPWTLCWCCGCCHTVDSACEAGQSVAMEVCNH